MILDIKQPKYTTTLPISKRKVEFRPFTVKEEKFLLMAKEEGKTDIIINAVGQIIVNCTFGKENIGDLNKIDAEWLFIHLRNKSMGEGVEIRAICKECKDKIPMTLNLEDIQVINIPKKKNNTFEILPNVWLTFKYPSMRDSLSVSEPDGVLAIASSLDTIIEGDNVKQASDFTMEERVELIESLTNAQVNSFDEFFSNFPVIVLDVPYKCKCGTDNNIHIEGIENFFQ